MENSGPSVGPVVISEIMYNAPGSEEAELEYIELVNVTGADVYLQSTVSTQFGPELWQVRMDIVQWSMSAGVEFTFPVDTMLAAGERLLLVKNLAAFSAHYTGVPAGTKIFQWTSGSLDNNDERIELAKPGDQEWHQDRYIIRVDRVNYADRGGWPTEPDGEGMSLDRIDESSYGNDKANWQSATPTPGY